MALFNLDHITHFACHCKWKRRRNKAQKNSRKCCKNTSLTDIEGHFYFQILINEEYNFSSRAPPGCTTNCLSVHVCTMTRSKRSPGQICITFDKHIFVFWLSSTDRFDVTVIHTQITKLSASNRKWARTTYQAHSAWHGQKMVLMTAEPDSTETQHKMWHHTAPPATVDWQLRGSLWVKDNRVKK